MMGRAYENQRQFRRAIATYKDIIEHDVDAFGASVRCGNLMLMLNMGSGAAKYFKNAIRLNPYSATAHFGLILTVKLFSKDIEIAVRFFKRRMVNDPENF